MQSTDPEERKWHLATKSLTGTLTPDEEQEWRQVTSDKSFNSKFEQMRKYWTDAEKLPYLQIHTDSDWESVSTKIRSLHKSPSRRFPRVLKYAASIAILVASCVFIWTLAFQYNNTLATTTIEAPAGARTSITLPDGSKVWLNAESRITFDQQFALNNRNLNLEGEAFFDVRKGDVPFNVHTDAYNVAVLGTAFNVKAYSDDDFTSTTLIRGLLKVTRMNSTGETEELLLHPNEKVVLHGNTAERLNSKIVLEKNVNATAEADWKDGWLTVRGESLEELSRKITRLYNVKIVFETDSMKSYRYSGRIQQLSLEQVMNVLALTSPVRFEIHEKLVKLSIDEAAKAKYK